MRKRRWLTWLGSALIVGGAALVVSYWWAMHERGVAQQRAKEWLNRSVTVHRTTPARPVHRGDDVGEVEIPRLHLSVMVLEGDDAGILEQGAGHIPGTALPSGNGNIGIAAHRDTFFRPLRLIRANDVITLNSPAGRSRYAVTETEVVKPTAISVLARAPGRDLTLVTCYPFFYVGSAPERFVVHARRIGDTIVARDPLSTRFSRPRQ